MKKEKPAPQFVGYKVPLFFYFVLEVALPVAVALIWIFNPPRGWETEWRGLMRGVTLYIAMPAYGIYAFILAKAHAPERLKDWFIVFSPLLWAGISAWYFASQTELFSVVEFWDVLQWEGLSLYLGLNFTIAVGLWALVFLKNDGRNTLLPLLVLIGLSVFLFGPAIAVFSMGWHAAEAWATELGGSQQQRLLIYGDYLLGVLWSALSAWPILKSSYKSGLL